MFCKGCGKLIDSANKHCPHCGRDVDALSGGTGFWDLVVDSEEATRRIPAEQLAPQQESPPILFSEGRGHTVECRSIPPAVRR